MEVKQIAIVQYQVATYSGEVEVFCTSYWENEEIENRAKIILQKRAGKFPMGYENFKVTSRRDI